MSANQETVREYMDAFAVSDHARVLACLTDDVIWVMPGAFHLTGKVEFDREIENDAFVGSPILTTTRIVEQGDVLVLEGTARAKRRDGGDLNVVFCDVFLMRDAKIRQLTSYVMEIKAP